ncbi:uncharacterized protein LOC144915669 [Branchiostoma floridae x Branchiostoma belcheri]
MEQNVAMLYFLLLVSNHLILVSATALRCPDNCHSYKVGVKGREQVVCRCPGENWVGSPCSWIGYGGTYSFSVCLDAIPTGFVKATQSISIQHLRSPTILERSFPNNTEVQQLQISKSNISTVQPGAFQGLPLLEKLYLNDNRISSLEPDTFLGLEKVKNLYLQRNAISVISQYAFRSLPLLARLILDNNRLRSVPVDALLPLTSLKLAHLQNNYITTIDSQVLCLSQNQALRLMLADNQLKCDDDLTWFIYNLPDMDCIIRPDLLTCASPANLSGILLATVRKDIVSSTNTDRSPQGIRLGRCDETSTTAGPHTHHTSLHNHTSLYNHTIPTEMPYTNTMPGSQYTTGTDIVTLRVETSITEEDDSRHDVNAIITAVVVPILILTASGFVVYLCDRCHGTGLVPHNAPAETDGNSARLGTSDRDSVTGRRPTPGQDQTSEGNNDIEPYAVSYMDVSGKGENGKLSPYATTSFANIQPIEDNDDIEPYAVSYMDVSGKRKNGKLAPYATTFINEDPGSQLQPYSVTHDEDPGPQLQPYSVTHDEDPGPQLQPYSVTNDEDPGPQLQPYSVTHDEDPGPQLQPYAVTHGEDLAHTTRGHTGQVYTSLTNVTNQQATNITQPVTQSKSQSLPKEANIKPNYERGYPPVRDSRCPYGLGKGKEVPSVSGTLCKNGSQHTGAENHSKSHMLYNTAHGQPESENSTTRKLYNTTDGQSESKDSTTRKLYNTAHGQPESENSTTRKLYNTTDGQSESKDSTTRKLYNTAHGQPESENSTTRKLYNTTDGQSESEDSITRKLYNTTDGQSESEDSTTRKQDGE